MFTKLRRDIPASLVVFLVAVPLSLGIALASKAPIIAGLIAAVVGGIVTGILSGAPLQVSGPAAGLTVVVAGLVTQFDWPTMCAITAIAGAVQLCLGWLKVARGAMAIAPAVVHGMLAGIGISIALAQLHVVLGGNPESSPLANLGNLPAALGSINLGSAMLGVIAIVILWGWKKLPWKGLHFIPAQLVAVAVGTVVAILAKLDVPRVDLPDAFAFTPLKLSDDISGFIVAVLTVAIIASVESLLSAVAVDKLHSGERANLDRELTAQGAGNLVSGLLGGLPITGVIVRSSANVAAGGVSRWSAVLHGVWVLLFALFLSNVIEQIPLAVLAALLVHVGFNLVNMHHIRELRTHGEAPIYYATVLGVVCLNLLAGVGLGVALSILMTLRKLSRTEINLEEREGAWRVAVQGSLTFASVPKLSAALAKVPVAQRVVVDLGVDYIDHAAFETLHGWRVNYERAGGTVDIDETHENWYAPAASGKPRHEKSMPGDSAASTTV